MSHGPHLSRPMHAAAELGVSQSTLRSWGDRGKISFARTVGGQRRYDITSFDPTHKFVVHQGSYQAREETKAGALYARVSSAKQKDDLQRQIQTLQTVYPNYKVFTDVCSGLNYNRPGLKRLLVAVQKGTIGQVVVAHKDRLARFATDLIKWIIEESGATLVILNKTDVSREQELTEDLISIVHVFSCRLNGKRSYSSRKKGLQQTEKGEQGSERKGARRSQSGSPGRKKSKSSGPPMSPDQARSTAETACPSMQMVQGYPEDVQPGAGIRSGSTATPKPRTPA